MGNLGLMGGMGGGAAAEPLHTEKEKAWNFAGAPFENVPESESGAMGGAVLRFACVVVGVRG